MEAPIGPTAATTRPLRWDIFCRVVDNFGDIGVCWRLAAQLAALGAPVRLVTDDASALQWMAPDRGHLARGVAVWPWPGPADAADVVIEAFGCDPPPAYVEAMRATDPVWVNLEYLSAEDYVERSHGLASPRGDGLRKWFYYPGFTAGTGGLLREPGLIERQTSFDRGAWLAALGVRLGLDLAARPGAHERRVSLFCYDHVDLAPLLDRLAAEPTLLLLTPGPAQRLVAHGRALPRGLRTVHLPWLSQVDYDHLLWSCDLNCVRGEDSFVRALWAGAPLLWQAYPQDDGAHAAKLDAAARRLGLPPEVASLWRAWNGLGAWPATLPATTPWHQAAGQARATLLGQPDLATQLWRFVSERPSRLGPASSPPGHSSGHAPGAAAPASAGLPG